MLALERAADLVSEIVGDESGESAAFPFADEVAVQLLPDELRDAATVLAHGVGAATSVATAAVRGWISNQDPGAFLLIDP
jgi:hypothetical protein